MTLSPISKRRLAAFRAHKRGYWSLWLFLALFGISLFAEFICNDRPLLVRYAGQWYSPVLTDYAESDYASDMMPTTADYSDPELSRLSKSMAGCFGRQCVIVMIVS